MILKIPLTQGQHHDYNNNQHNLKWIVLKFVRMHFFVILNTYKKKASKPQ